VIESWNAGKIAFMLVFLTNLYHFCASFNPKNCGIPYHFGIKKISRKSSNFKWVQNQPDASQKHDCGQSFSALKFCHNIKTAEGVAWPKLKSTHRKNLAKLVPLPDKIDPSQD